MYHTVAVVVVSIGGEGGGVFFCVTLIRWNSPKPPSDFLQCLPLAVSYQFHCCILIPIQTKVGIRKNNNSISFPAGGGGEGEYFCNSLLMSFVLLLLLFCCCPIVVSTLCAFCLLLLFSFVFLFRLYFPLLLLFRVELLHVSLLLSFAPVCVVLLLPLLPIVVVVAVSFWGNWHLFYILVDTFFPQKKRKLFLRPFVVIGIVTVFVATIRQSHVLARDAFLLHLLLLPLISLIVHFVFLGEHQRCESWYNCTFVFGTFLGGYVQNWYRFKSILWIWMFCYYKFVSGRMFVTLRSKKFSVG